VLKRPLNKRSKARIRVRGPIQKSVESDLVMDQGMQYTPQVVWGNLKHR